MNLKIITEANTIMSRHIMFIIFIVAIHPTIYSQVSNQISLNNYYLWQTKDAVSHTLGMPDHSGSSESLEWVSYNITTNCELFFSFKDFAPSYIYSIQITGKDYKMPLFAGIKLGDSFEKVTKIFGLPDSLNVVNEHRLCVYGDKNYSFLFDGQKLYSIKINAYKEMFEHDYNKSFQSWNKIVKIILAKDSKRLVEYIRPDIEVNYDGSIYRITKPMGLYSLSDDELGKKLFFGERKSVLQQLLIDDGKNSQFTMRFSETDGNGEVINFTNNEIIDQIVLMPHEGRLKIYEVHFKNIR